MKQGVFGGTFNPIHNSHVYLMQEAMRGLHLDQLLLIPTYLPPHKEAQDLASPEHRLEMCQLVAGEYSNVMVCDYEIRKGGKSYSYETLEYLKAQNSQTELFFIMGGDMYLTLLEWKCPERIFHCATVCAMAREQGEYEALQEYEKKVSKAGGTTVLLQSEAHPLSSTDIRELRKAGKSVQEEVPPAVWNYIKAHHLYQGGIA